MTSAFYGRMNVGSCVKRDFGFIGCSHDVMSLMDRKCSGRQRCEFKVVDPNFENIHPCDAEFKNYLDASYKCVKGAYETSAVQLPYTAATATSAVSAAIAVLLAP